MSRSNDLQLFIFSHFVPVLLLNQWFDNNVHTRKHTSQLHLSHFAVWKSDCSVLIFPFSSFGITATESSRTYSSMVVRIPINRLNVEMYTHQSYTIVEIFELEIVEFHVSDRSRYNNQYANRISYRLCFVMLKCSMLHLYLARSNSFRRFIKRPRWLK